MIFYFDFQEFDDEVVLAYTQSWVQAMIADFAVCPFTVQPMRAGIPRGHVRYTGMCGSV